MERVRLPAAAGVGFKPVHFDDIMSGDQPIEFVEIHAENYMGEGGLPHAQLRALCGRYALSVHGVGLSIGSAQPLDADHLDRLKILCDRYRPASFSEHLAWSSHDGAFLNDLLPLPYNEETLARIVGHIDQVQSVLGRQMLLENPSTYVEFSDSSIPETEFLDEIARRTGCGLLLDVNNVFVSACNHGADPHAYLASFPLARVKEVHLGGHDEQTDDIGAALLIDSHGAAVADPVWALFRSVIARTGPLPTLIEWDNDVPDWATLSGRSATRQVRARTNRAHRGRVRMAMFADVQNEFATALLDADRPVPLAVTSHTSRSPVRRFGVYRNNVVASLVNALRTRFPVVESIVGEEFFAAMARVFVTANPPRSPVLHLYGDAFPEFIEEFPPAADLAYLADVARLEAARTRAFHAADAQPAEPREWARLDPEQLIRCRVALHPSMQIVCSQHPIVTIWAMNSGKAELRPIDDDGPEDALVVRPHHDVSDASVATGRGNVPPRAGRRPLAWRGRWRRRCGLRGIRCHCQSRRGVERGRIDGRAAPGVRQEPIAMTASPLASQPPSNGAVALTRRSIEVMNSIPYWFVALMARIPIAGVFWQSGQTKVDGWRLSESAIELFRNEYQLPLVNPTLAACGRGGCRARVPGPAVAGSGDAIFRAGAPDHDLGDRGVRLSTGLADARHLGRMLSDSDGARAGLRVARPSDRPTLRKA